MAVFGPYPAKVVSVHDGDTVLMDLDLGFGLWLGLHCRVFGINAPELRTAEGKAAAQYAQQLLRPGDDVKVLSHGWDKYGGRFDGEITMPDGEDFAAVMLKSGQAIPYAG